jgi:plastocyanin
MSVRILICAIAFLVPGLSQGEAQEPAKIAIKLFQFQPKSIEVKKGTTVMWENGDAIDHSVTAGKPGDQSAAFDSGFFNKGGHFEHRFETEGAYVYFCRRHPNMKGEIRVTE